MHCGRIALLTIIVAVVLIATEIVLVVVNEVIRIDLIFALPLLGFDKQIVLQSIAEPTAFQFFNFHEIGFLLL